MAGSADEMGSFVRGLSHKLSDLQLQITQATENEEASLRAVEDSIAELGKLKQKDSESQALVDKLTAEIANLRKTTTLEGIVSAPTIPGATTPAGMASTGIKVLQARSEDLDPNRRRALTRRALANLAALGVMPIVGGGGGGG